MSKIQDEEWIADSGSVYTKAEYEMKGNTGVRFKVRKAIAFNVGEDLAKYLVILHNEKFHNNQT